ncbi:MAG: exonuclease SbcCD subunit D [Cellulomonadaceae bacterium]
MRVLHTSDWHLGRTLHGVDLLEHQSAFLDHLVELVRAEDVDVVLVAGDVYDRAIPPVEAVTLLSDALRRLTERTQVVLTPGNHDSATRLGFGAELMRDGLHVRARPDEVGRPVEMHAGEESAYVYALPYLDPDAARFRLADDGAEPLARSHAAVMGAAMGRVRTDLARRRAGDVRRVPALVVAHAFVVGGQVSESERDIRVGGVDSVGAQVFEGVDYAALGHLHGPQQVRVGPGTLARYSGSPLAYSFSERHHAKSTVLLDLGPDGVRGEPAIVPAPVPRRLSEVRGTLSDVLGAAGEAHLEDWVRVVVTDDARPADLVARIRARFPHALVIQHEPPRRETSSPFVAVGAATDPAEVCQAFVRYACGAAPTPGEQAVLRAAVERATAAGRSA